MSTSEYWTTTEAAGHCGVAPGTYRRYQSLLSAPAAVSRQVGRSGEALYDAAAVRAWQANRTGRGARTDRDHEELLALAQQIVDAYPGPRTPDIQTLTLDDGVTVTVGWHQTTYSAVPRDGNAFLVHDGSAYAVASAPTSLVSAEARIVYAISHSDPDDLARDLAAPVRAARQDLARQESATRHIVSTRIHALADVVAAASRVTTALATPGRYDLMDAYAYRRHVVATARDLNEGAGPLLTPAEIADAAGMTLDEVAHAH